MRDAYFAGSTRPRRLVAMTSEVQVGARWAIADHAVSLARRVVHLVTGETTARSSSGAVRQ